MTDIFKIAYSRIQFVCFSFHVRLHHVIVSQTAYPKERVHVSSVDRKWDAQFSSHPVKKFRTNIGLRAASFKRPLLSVDVSVCLSVCPQLWC